MSDWQMSGIFTGSTGAPLSITGTCTGGGIIDAACYPNLVAGFHNAHVANAPAPKTAAIASTTQYLNYNAFSNAPAYTYGNASRAAPYGLFAPTVRDLDLSIRREFPIHDAVKFSFQADAFNITNSVYFTAPSTALPATTAAGPTSSFGKFSSQANQPRKWQFSARVSF